MERAARRARATVRRAVRSTTASAKTTSRRTASTGCTPNRFTLTPLDPGPLPRTSSSVASRHARPSGSTTARRSGDDSKSISDAAASSTSPSATPPAKTLTVIVSRIGSRSAHIVISPMPQSNISAGSSRASSSRPRQRRKRCTIQNAPTNSATDPASPRRYCSTLRTARRGFSACRFARDSEPTPASAPT